MEGKNLLEKIREKPKLEKSLRNMINVINAQHQMVGAHNDQCTSSNGVTTSQNGTTTAIIYEHTAYSYHAVKAAHDH